MWKILKNKQHSIKELLSNFHLNGSTLKFHAQNERLDLGVTLEVKMSRNTQDF